MVEISCTLEGEDMLRICVYRLIVLLLLVGGINCTTYPFGVPPPPTSPVPAGSATAPAKGPDCIGEVRDVNFPDRPNQSSVQAGGEFAKIWELENICPDSWRGYKAIRISGIFGPAEFPLPDLKSGQIQTVAVQMQAPTEEPGLYRATYRIVSSDGRWISGIWVDIQVVR